MRRLASIILVLLCACTETVYVPVTRTEYRDVVRRDSVQVRDSIFIREQLRGDTVFITQVRDRWRERVTDVHDTMIVQRTDTISVPVVRTEYVEKPLPRFVRGCVAGFWVLLLITVLRWRKVLAALLKQVLRS